MEMEKKQQICCGRGNSPSDRPPPPGLTYPLFVTYDPECKDDTNQIFFSTLPNIHNQQHQQQHYHCRISELSGREIRGCFHGWLILCKYPLPAPGLFDFCLWNPVTLEFIHLPRLNLRSSEEGDADDDYYYYDNDEDYIDDNDPKKKLKDDIALCCLSSPPSNPDSVVLLSRYSEPTIFFCLLRNETKQWTGISYAHQIRNISNCDGDVIKSLVCFNGKIYAFTGTISFIRVDILVRQARINLIPCGMLPHCHRHSFIPYLIPYSCEELFTIVQCFKDFELNKKMESLRLFKFDFSTMLWEELKSAKDRVFFLDDGGCNHFSCRAIEPESGNYIHITRDSCKVYSYNIEDKTISLSSLPCPDLPPGMWQCVGSTWLMPENRLVDDLGEANCTSDIKEEQGKEEEIVVRSVISGEVDRMMNEQQLGEMMIATAGRLLDMPFHILELIAERCVAVEYLNFRATCKHCRLAAPPIQWSTATALGRLQSHSLVSPWLMVLDIDQGIFTFTDPKFGDKYFMTTIPESIRNARVCYSNYGWLLISNDSRCLFFFNPFTRAIIQLPPVTPLYVSDFSSFAFSAPPTSSDCIVGCALDYEGLVYITSPGKSEWLAIDIGLDILDNQPFHDSQTFCGRNLYVLCRDGQLGVLEIGTDYSWKILIAEPPKTCCTTRAQFFLVKCGNDLLSIVVGEFGECVEVFKMNRCTLRWETVDDLGKHMICVCNMTSFSVVAKTPGMENKIYFPRFYGGNMIFYSLDTCKYHTFGGKGEDKEKAFTDFFPTKEQLLSLWIEPNWSS